MHFIGPTRAQVLRRLRWWFVARDRPITLGQGAPAAVIAREPDGRYALRPLFVDRARADVAAEAARARGGPWMPEMEDAFLRPGEPIVIAASARQLAAHLEAMEWRW